MTGVPLASPYAVAIALEDLDLILLSLAEAFAPTDMTLSNAGLKPSNGIAKAARDSF